MQSTHYLTCHVGRQLYGIPVNLVIEVLQMVALDELPASPPDILGLLTLRNHVMPVIDLCQRFATADITLTLQTPLIAIQQDDNRFALVVDTVDNVVDVSSGTWQTHDSDPYVTQTVRVGDTLIYILNLERFLDSTKHHKNL